MPNHAYEPKKLADMEDDEVGEWLLIRRAQLANHKIFVQSYVNRRARRRQRPNGVDAEYAAFLHLADDLLELIDELLKEYQPAQ